MVLQKSDDDSCMNNYNEDDGSDIDSKENMKQTQKWSSIRDDEELRKLSICN